MMKRKQYILALLVLLISTAAFSQKKKQRISRDKIKAYKIAYLTEQLNLTEKESEKFWPVYNLYDEKLHQLRRQESSRIRKLLSDEGSLNDISESDAKDVIQSVSKIKDKTHNTYKEYFNKLKQVLPYKKILKLLSSERAFKKHLFERLKKAREKE
ncbi:MAG: hypothetical protein JXR05_04105 [Flavobacteriaceae bacterium]